MLISSPFYVKKQAAGISVVVPQFSCHTAIVFEYRAGFIFPGKQARIGFQSYW